MRLFTTLSMCLICTTAFSQVPPQDGATPPAINPAMQGPQAGFNQTPGVTVTQRSRVRAFNSGADGQIRSVYLSNGSVVDLSGFGPGFGSQLRKGNRIGFTGTRTSVNGQTIIVPQQITLNHQTYTAMANPGPYGQPGVGQPGPGRPGIGRPGVAGPDGGPGAPPPPPPGGPGAPPPPPAPMAGGPGAPPPPPPGQNGPGRPGPGPRRRNAQGPDAGAGMPVPPPPPRNGTQPPPPVAPTDSVTPGAAAPGVAAPPTPATPQTLNQ